MDRARKYRRFAERHALVAARTPDAIEGLLLMEIAELWRNLATYAGAANGAHALALRSEIVIPETKRLLN